MKKQRLFIAFTGAVVLALLTVGYDARSAPGDLYLPQAEEGTILKFSPDGTKSMFASGLDQPGGVAFDRAGNLFVSVGPGQFRDITKITPGGEMTVFATGISIPGGLAFDGVGNLYVTFSTGDTGSIWKFTPDGAKSLFGSYHGFESGSPIALAFNAAGDLYATIPPGPKANLLPNPSQNPRNRPKPATQRFSFLRSLSSACSP